jgi:hypothetical protein
MALPHARTQRPFENVIANSKNTAPCGQHQAKAGPKQGSSKIK